MSGEVKAPSTLPAFLSLFTSTGTLICCALPALLVSIGAGAVMAGLIEAVPQITWLGKNKELVFSIAAGMIAVAGAWQWHARSLPCPVDPAQARACTRARRISWIVWWISVGAFVIGAFFAFFAAGLLA
ncbi:MULTISPECIES: hypothetical protein [Hyphomonas]|uniref:Mercuric transport protein MerT n=1 Tax=Hyphomonas atlantica TaxID=1280948 RepID=A0A059E9V5_9PROT|nr:MULTISPECIES: hypothetical protein [Hyphomonas]KCZ64360.1 hypothetical protein HY36_13495 [Hyphomonas atlantica]MAM07926.1 hypothetical protein [Hyphomonas sp.]HBQ47631.1 hypothetical protein [Hyphomonas atlantica]|tara:strand:- start:1726 stop:2112 length:387 start_codon:yes stop_codon:yes gene_type:complete